MISNNQMYLIRCVEEACNLAQEHGAKGRELAAVVGALLIQGAAALDLVAKGFSKEEAIDAVDFSKRSKHADGQAGGAGGAVPPVPGEAAGDNDSAEQ